MSHPSLGAGSGRLGGKVSARGGSSGDLRGWAAGSRAGINNHKAWAGPRQGRGLPEAQEGNLVWAAGSSHRVPWDKPKSALSLSLPSCRQGRLEACCLSQLALPKGT